MDVFDALGFHWDRAQVPSEIPVHSIERVCSRFRPMLAEFVWDAMVLEGDPFSLTEVETLVRGGTVGGANIVDVAHIADLARACRQLLFWVEAGRFELTEAIFLMLHGCVIGDETIRRRRQAEEWESALSAEEIAALRRVTVSPVGDEGRFQRRFAQGAGALREHVPRAFEQAAAFFLFAVMERFFLVGNARTARLMMNGVLLSRGIDAISISADRVQAFSDGVARFYESRDGTEVMVFLIDCHPDAAKIHSANPVSEPAVFENGDGGGENGSKA